MMAGFKCGPSRYGGRKDFFFEKKKQKTFASWRDDG
jgi:hypothetical protein